MVEHTTATARLLVMKAFRRHLSRESETSEINISPLIDIVFILLIFFIVVAEIRQETGIEVRKPMASASAAIDGESIHFGLQPDGSVYHAGSAVPLEDVRHIVRRALAGSDRPVVIQGDQATPLQFVVRLIEQAQLGGAKTTNISTQLQ